MRFTVNQPDLSRALTLAKLCIETRTTIPILQHIRLTAESNMLTLRVTNLECSISIEIPANASEPVDITVPARQLSEAVGTLDPNEIINFYVNNNKGEPGRCTVASERATFDFIVGGGAEYPDILTVHDGLSFVMPASDLRNLLEPVSHAISQEDTRYYLKGIYLHGAKIGEAKRKSLVGVATDGHRLCRRWLTMPRGAAGLPGVIVPKQAVTNILKLVGKDSHDIHLDVSVNHLSVTVPGVIFVTRVIDGTFPDYKNVIPDPSENTVRVNKKALRMAVDKVRIMRADNTMGAVRLTTKKDGLTLSMANPELGRSEVALDAETAKSGIEMGVNYRYLHDLTRFQEGEEIVLHVKDPGSPLLCLSADGGSGDYALMPMRV